MKKIISLFKRDYEGNRQVYNEVVEGAEWVLEGEGVATQKVDGTCAMVRNGKLHKRYDLKAKKGRHEQPANWEPAQEHPDSVTTSWPGWLPIGEGPEDKWFREAKDALGRDVLNNGSIGLANGTYELCGPKVQGNPERYPEHRLIPHGSILLEDAPRTFEGIRDYLSSLDIEGIVWHHPDGRMVKIKKKDFGFKRYSPSHTIDTPHR